MDEIWKDVKGYEGLYKVSNTGRVYSIRNNRLLTPCVTGTVFETRPGYYRVMLQKEGKRKNAAVHRLVADAFHPNPENKPHVHHKDNNPHNNHADNLEWLTTAEHAKHNTKGKKNK